MEVRHFVTFPVKLKKVAAGGVTQATQHGGVQNASYDFATVGMTVIALWTTTLRSSCTTKHICKHPFNTP